jgi:DNA-directed RNA polymerase subunit H (RpoH/RPB5)
MDNIEIVDNLYCLNMLYNIIQILEDRGYKYLNTNYEIIKMEKDKIDVDDDYKPSNYKYIISKNNKYIIISKKKMNYLFMVFFESFCNFENNVDINVTFKRCKEYITSHIYWEHVTKVYFICPDKYEIQIKKKIKTEGLDDFIETIKYTNMLYNPTKHNYFNKHMKIINFDQKYKKYKLKLPIILKNDVACRWYGYNINDIIKIIRKDNTIFYRIVKDESFVE